VEGSRGRIVVERKQNHYLGSLVMRVCSLTLSFNCYLSDGFSRWPQSRGIFTCLSIACTPAFVEQSTVRTRCRPVSRIPTVAEATHTPRKLHLLLQAGCYPYAQLVFGFCVIAAGRLDFNARKEGSRFREGVGHVAYNVIVRSSQAAV
jgi:hypothetical protein